MKPDQPELVLSLVQTLFQDGQNDAAEKFAKELIEKQKTYGSIYDVLYLHYVRNNHPDLGEELLKKKIANNPSQGSYVLQLAFHYYMTNRQAGDDRYPSTTDLESQAVPGPPYAGRGFL